MQKSNHRRTTDDGCAIAFPSFVAFSLSTLARTAQQLGFVFLFLLSLNSLWSVGAATEDKSSAPKTNIDRWREAAQKEEAWASFNLGLAYHLGKDVEENKSEAVKWYRKAAEKGFAQAQANLGYCYDTGFGVQVDYPEAVKWYQQAALQGNAFAQYNLGKKYQSGPGIVLDPKLALKWLTLAAQQKYPPAFFSLGQLYTNEMLGQTDDREAYKWFRLAAEQGLLAAQHALGYMHYAGKGVPQSYYQAVNWYKLAASRNFPDSHYNLALCYEKGLGVPQNLVAAVSHYRSASESGHAFSEYSLGVCYYEGKGVEVNLVEAYKWWNLAAMQGVPEAASSKDILSRLLTDAQKAEAQRLAAEFSSRVPTNAVSEHPSIIHSPISDASEIKRVATGFFVSSDGYLITNWRSISEGKHFQVITEGGTFSATLFKNETLNDLALLKVDGAFQPLVLGNSRDVGQGSSVTVQGFDEANQTQFNPKAAAGTVTALFGFQADSRQLSIEPPLAAGFTGAPVVNNSGKVIGMMIPQPEQPRAPEARGRVAKAGALALKSDHIISFVRSIPELRKILENQTPEETLNEQEVPSRVRAATARIIVL